VISRRPGQRGHSGQLQEMRRKRAVADSTIVAQPDKQGTH